MVVVGRGAGQPRAAAPASCAARQPVQPSDHRRLRPAGCSRCSRGPPRTWGHKVWGTRHVVKGKKRSCSVGTSSGGGSRGSSGSASTGTRARLAGGRRTQWLVAGPQQAARRSIGRSSWRLLSGDCICTGFREPDALRPPGCRVAHRRELGRLPGPGEPSGGRGRRPGEAVSLSGCGMRTVDINNLWGKMMRSIELGGVQKNLGGAERGDTRRWRESQPVAMLALAALCWAPAAPRPGDAHRTPRLKWRQPTATNSWTFSQLIITPPPTSP